MATPAQAIMNIWTEHRNPEGRTYWFNTGTKQSVWEKPDDLKSPFERALSKTQWREYVSGGRKYFYNTETKESKWDMPEELVTLLEKVEKENSTTDINKTAFTPIGGQVVAQVNPGALVNFNPLLPASSAQQNNGLDSALVVAGPNALNGVLPLAVSGALPARPNFPDDPVIPHNGFATVEEGEKAFMHLLRKAGVDANWTWDQTMRAIITDPLYKALNSLAEKKAAWQKYTDNLRAKEQEEREARLSKLRPTLRNMLKGNPNVFHYTTFATADKLFAQHPTWQQGKIEAERKLIFEEYVAELKQREVQETRAARTRSIAKVVNLFKQMDVDVLTRWRQAHTMLMESEQWHEDLELQKLPTLDILLAFEDYSRVREREYEDQVRRAQVEKTRRERKARESFKVLLQDLISSGKITARSKWKDVYPSFAEDERYLNILGNPGSNPLELFWDAVDALDQQLDTKISVVQKIIDKHNVNTLSVEPGDSEHAAVTTSFSVNIGTTETEFLSVVQADDEAKILSSDELQQVFHILQGQALKKVADEKRRAERRQRHLQDDLRYALKKLPDPLDLNLTFEAAVPLIEALPEYKVLDDEGRRVAFAKFVKRQKERLRDTSEDGASATSRKRKEPHRDHRDSDRDRERPRARDFLDRDDRDMESKDRDRATDYHGSSRRHHKSYDDYKQRSSRDYRDRDGDRREDDWDHESRARGHKDSDRNKRKDSRTRDHSNRPLDDMDEFRDTKRGPEREPSPSRAEKRPRYGASDRASSQPREATTPQATAVRDDTPEEGEI